jgi:hypothetical protein
MKTFMFALLVGVVSQFTHADSGTRKIRPHDQNSLKEISLDVRDTHYDSAKRRHYLQFVQTKMSEKLSSDLKIKPQGLNAHFMGNAEAMKLLWTSPWIELQTEFYVTLHQEALNEKWKVMNQKRKFTDYGKNLTDSMMVHLGNYVPTKEGRHYNRWQNISVAKNGKSQNVRLPFFLMSSKVQDLIKIDAHAAYESLFPKVENETSLNPSLSTFLKNTRVKEREDLQELAEVVQLNHRIYLRAVANAAKTVASVYYLTGEYSLTQTQSKVSSFIDQYCEGCSNKDREDYEAAAMTFVQNRKKEMRVYNGGRDIVSSFCMDLQTNGYRWAEEEQKPKLDPRYEVYTAVRDNTYVDMSHVRAQMMSIRLNALRKAVYNHDLGVLFLTNKLSLMNKTNTEVYGTVLGCKPETLTADASRVKGAIEEARQNVETYLKRVNEKLRGSTFSMKYAKDALEYFTQTNVSATAEAVMTFPQGMNHVMSAVLELDKDVKRRKRIDKAVAWGGVVIGVALVVSGIGAPEGVAVLLTVASMTKGAISGAYHLARSQQEKKFHKELSIARAGLGTSFYLDGNLSQHYSEYRDLRTQYLVDFAGAIYSFGKIHYAAISKVGGDVPKAHGLIKGTMQKCKVVGKDMTQEEITGAILGAVAR